MNVWTLLGRVTIDPTDAKRGLKDSERAAKDAGRGMERAIDDSVRKSTKRLNDLGKSMQDIGTKWSQRVTAPIAALSGIILKVAGDFESSMNRVGALTSATGDQMDRLSGLARQLGATTAFSASQAADAMGFLAQAGFEVEEIYDALPGTLELAAAGQLDLAAAADIASNVLTGMGLAASEINRVNDVMAATSAAANTNISQLGEAFKFAGPVASALGISVEEAGAAMGLLSNAGLQASSAGTGLRQILTTLVLKADETGVATRDAAGNMRPLADMLADLEARGFTAEQAMESFGQRGGPALLALLSQGSDALRDFTGDLEEAGGTAKRLADAQMAGLNGALLKLRSAAEAVGLAIAESGLLEWATNMAERLAGLLTRVSEADPALLRLGVTIAAVAAAIGPLLLAAGSMVKLVALMRTGFIALRAVLATVSWPITLITIAVIALWQAWERNFFGIRDITKRATDYLRDQFDRITRFGTSLVKNWETVVFAWREIQEAIGHIARAAGDAVSAGWETSTLAIQRAFSAMFRFVESGLSSMTGGIIDGINALIRGINRTLGTEIEEIRAIAMTAWADIDDGISERLDAAQDRVAAAQEAMAREVRYIRTVVAETIDVIERGMERTEEGIEVVEEAAAVAGMSVEELLEIIETDSAGAVEALQALADGVTEIEDNASAAAEGSIARLRERIREAWTAYENAADDAGRIAALNLHAHLEATLEAIEERIAGLDLEIPITLQLMWPDGTPAPTPLPDDAFNLDRQLPTAPGGTPGRPSVPIPSARDAGAGGGFMALPGLMEIAGRDMLDVMQSWATFAERTVPRPGIGLTTGERAVPLPGIGVDVFADRGARERDRAARLARQRARAATEARWSDPDSLPDHLLGGPLRDVPQPEIGVDIAAPRDIPTPDVGVTIAEPSAIQQVIGTVLGGLQQLGEVLIAEVPLVGTAFKALTSGGGPMGAFVAVLTEMITGSEAFQSLMKRMSETLAPMIERIIGPLVEAFEVLLNALWPIIEVALALVETALKPITWIITTIIAPVFTLVARMIAFAWNAIATAINWALGWLGVSIPLVNLEGGGINPAPPPEKDPSRDKDPAGETTSPTAPKRDDPRTQSFGGTPQAIQLAIATPLVEAAYMMAGAAERFDATISSLLPTGGIGADLSVLPPFTSAIDRLTPVLERLLAEGVRIQTNAAATGATGASPTAYLRGL